MRSHELKRRFSEFFQKREHILVPSSAFLTKNPEYPLITSGIEPFSAYFAGDSDPMADINSLLGKPLGSLSAVSSQRCFRIQDSELVGDDSYLTSFEMLGAYTFGGYKKQTAIKVASDFFKNLNLFIDYVTVFSGEARAQWARPYRGGWGGLPFDKDTEYMWKELGVTYIQRLGLKENFWGPAGNGGVCGPTTEVYLKDIGVWSIIFLDYYFPGTHEELVSGKNFRKLERLDVGGIASVAGLERLTAVSVGKSNVFETDFFEGLFLPLQNIAVTGQYKRVIVDHLRTICFLINEGLSENGEQLFKITVRNLLRRLFLYERLLKLPEGLFEEIVEKIVRLYNSDFKNPADSIMVINDIIRKERFDFAKTADSGLKKLLKMKSGSLVIDAKAAFYFFEKFGLPFESIKEFGGVGTKNLTREDFSAEGGTTSLSRPGTGKDGGEKKSGIGSRIKELWNRIP